MVRLNKMRLDKIISNFNECLEDIDLSLSNLSDNDLLSRYGMDRILKNSIRHGVDSIFTNTEDYLGSILKKVGIGVSDKSLRDCITIAKNKNLIEPNFADCIISNIKIRNTFSHRYNQPSTETLIEFYTTNREVFLSQIEFMKKLIKESSEVDELDLFR